MSIFLFVLAGIAGGVIGGMGMGGGTVLIPILTIFFHINQKVAQAINLIVFIPMSIVVLIIYAKKKMIDFKSTLWVCLPAIATSVVCAVFVKKVDDKWLSSAFGIFLIILAVVMLAVQIAQWIKQVKIKKAMQDIEPELERRAQNSANQGKVITQITDKKTSQTFSEKKGKRRKGKKIDKTDK